MYAPILLLLSGIFSRFTVQCFVFPANNFGATVSGSMNNKVIARTKTPFSMRIDNEDGDDELLLDQDPVDFIDEGFLGGAPQTSRLIDKEKKQEKKLFKPEYDDLLFANRDFMKNLWLWAAVYSLPILLNALNHYGTQRIFWA